MPDAAVAAPAPARAKRKRRDPRESYCVIADRECRALGAGKTLAKALDDARDGARLAYEGDRCPHCGLYPDQPDEREWRAFSCTRQAFEMMTCGVPYEDALIDDPALSWCAGRKKIVYLDRPECVRCHGKGRLPRAHTKPGSPPMRCPDCDQGWIVSEGIEPELPPDEAAFWRGSDRGG